MLERGDPRPTVLLTGFGPFPGIPSNVSADLVRKVARLARRALPEFHFAVAVLPTEWMRAPRLVAALHMRYRPMLALHFGVASGAESIRLEMEGRNFCRPALDAAGALPSASVLCEDGPSARHATIAVKAIAKELNARGYPAFISDDAGGYLCNAVLYHSLAHAEARGGCQVGFVHIPPDLSEPSRMAEAIQGALEIIKIALEPISKRASLTST
ncbi:MAG TPA: pyroglutamyl-peptidase I [Hyphomicrobium sp.]|jgi:pyroglutamyl-peptidase